MHYLKQLDSGNSNGLVVVLLRVLWAKERLSKLFCMLWQIIELLIDWKTALLFPFAIRGFILFWKAFQESSLVAENSECLDLSRNAYRFVTKSASAGSLLPRLSSGLSLSTERPVMSRSIKYDYG